MNDRSIYPFPAIVGQEEMKTALLLNVVNPRIGGVLVRGEKGTAKSTAVRALAELLPGIEVAAGCPFSCDPARPDALCPDCARTLAEQGSLPSETRRIRVTELPVGATEDRVLGTLDLERAIRQGERRFEPGLLAAAHRGILYVDEVNLLEDHIVDVLLDAAAMGVNTVEREGVSFTHAAEFVLVGTMNPEEGELRPQLLDRFGLCVEVRGADQVEARLEVVTRHAAFEAGPETFRAQWSQAGQDLARSVVAARELLPAVRVPEGVLRQVVQLALDSGVDGHRADLVMVKTARTLAALDGRREAGREDVRRAAALALPHRMRRKPFQQVAAGRGKVEQLLARA
jgi:magnesium chelatase subunit I